MRSESKTINSLFAVVAMLAITLTAYADTIPSGFSRPLEWSVGAQFSPAFVPGTNSFLKGNNPLEKRISASFSGDLRPTSASVPSPAKECFSAGCIKA